MCSSDLFNNYMHRDLKPSNIFLSVSNYDDNYSDGTGTRILVKIGDFGLVRKVTQAGIPMAAVDAEDAVVAHGSAPTTAGTDLYMSPEQVR